MIQTLSRNDGFWEPPREEVKHYFHGFVLFSFKQCHLDNYPLLCELPLTESPCSVWGTVSPATSQALHRFSQGPNHAFLKFRAAGGCVGSVTLDRAPGQSLLCPWWCSPLFLSAHPPLLSQGARKRKLPGWKAVALVVVSGWDCKCVEAGGWMLG